jgi:hypothetical protein
VDRDQAQVVKSYWHYVVSELERLIKSEEIALRMCEPEELKKHQERIKVYEQLKTLPDDVMARS